MLSCVRIFLNDFMIPFYLIYMYNKSYTKNYWYTQSMYRT